ncbi:MAG: glycosyltransferase family 2 protein [Deltaproteobacteria bacterium]|nr:MAG: glycosyltransferase family 2 protein [Deltaproteobacteria bacterium]
MMSSFAKRQKEEKPMVSVILPTYNEAGNIKITISLLSEMLNDERIKGEIIVVDDDSPDGTADIVRNLATEYDVRVHLRKDQRGLATAVLKGIELAKGEICVVMDADLSHPVSKIPDMISPIIQGDCEAAVGCRWVPGGGCINWPLTRKIVSKGAGLLARGLTRLSDPTSGFMAVRNDVLDGIEFYPVGWKIVLEILVKTNCRFIEVPIMFSDRHEGESKLNLRVLIDYLRHLWKLYCFKYIKCFQFIKFCLVGISGFLIDTLVLVSLVELMYIDPRVAAIFGFLAAVSYNYILNRLWTFHLPSIAKPYYSYASFVLICLLGLMIRIGVMHLLIEYAGMGTDLWYVFASFLGIVAGTIFNFIGSKYVAFSENLFRNERRL